jgi:transposase
LPLYRQKAIHARDDVELDRALMAQWTGWVGFELEPIADAILDPIEQDERIFAEETTLPTSAPGSGKVKTTWLWTYARDDTPFSGSEQPLVADRFESSRIAHRLARHLPGYYGIQQVDGYAAYNRLAMADGANDSVTLAGCWCHVGKNFFDLHVNERSRFATQIEEDIHGYDPDHRHRIRQERSSAIVSELFASFDRKLPRLSGKSRLAETIRYVLRRKVVLERFLADGRIEIDSNIVEGTFRPHAIIRKNPLSAGSDGGGRTWATIITVLTTTKLNCVEPHAWLKLTFPRIATSWPNRDLDALMP